MGGGCPARSKLFASHPCLINSIHHLIKRGLRLIDRSNTQDDLRTTGNAFDGHYMCGIDMNRPWLIAWVLPNILNYSESCHCVTSD